MAARRFAGVRAMSSRKASFCCGVGDPSKWNLPMGKRKSLMGSASGFGFEAFLQMRGGRSRVHKSLSLAEDSACCSLPGGDDLNRAIDPQSAGVVEPLSGSVSGEP